MVSAAVFFDKDGTLIDDDPYNIDKNKICFVEYLWESLKLLQEAGFLIVIVTNQSGIANGYFKENDFLELIDFFYKKFKSNGLHLDGFYYCPHDPLGCINAYKKTCNCRKPKTGMFYKASQELGIDLKSSWCIGDILDDIEAGNQAGCRSILINNGNETKWLHSLSRIPEFKALNIYEAVKFIINPHF